jgi:hypothetical protein
LGRERNSGESTPHLTGQILIAVEIIQR